MKQRTSIEHFPSYEEVHAREQLLDSISGLSYTGTVDLLPPITVIPPGTKNFMAVRTETGNTNPQNDSSQVLNAVIRAGSHGFGIATACFGSGSRDAYVIKLNADPEHDVPQFVKQLDVDQKIEFGGEKGMFPELQLERQHFIIKTDSRGLIKIENRQKRYQKMQLIVAVEQPTVHEAFEDPLRVHPRTWSMPPDFLVRALRRHSLQRPMKQSFRNATGRRGHRR